MTSRLRVTALLAAVGMALTACSDSSVEPEQIATTAGETSEVVAELAGEAGLESSSIPGLRDIIDQYEGRLGEPGVTWYLAADVQAVLTSDQIAAIAAFQDELGRRVRERATDRFEGAPEGGRHGRRGEGRGPGAGEGSGRGFDMPGLDLTEEQQARIQEIMESKRPELEQIREAIAAGSLDREAAGELMKEIRDAIRSEIDAILTDEQKAALDARREEMTERRAEVAGEREAVREAEQAAMQDALGLTPDQIAAIEALREGVTGSAGSREEMRETHRTAMEEILSDTQEEIVVLHRAISSRMRIRRMGAGGQEGHVRGPRGFGPGGPEPSDG